MGYPVSEDKKIQKLSNLLVKIADQQGVEFNFSGQDIYALETFAHFGALVLFLSEAKELYEKIFNEAFSTLELLQKINPKMKKPTQEMLEKDKELTEQIPIIKTFPVNFFKLDENTYFGCIPQTSKDCSFTILSHFVVYVVEEYIKEYKSKPMLMINDKIPLDPLFEKFVKKLENKDIPIYELPTNSINN